MSSMAQAAMIACFIVGLLIIMGSAFLGTTFENQLPFNYFIFYCGIILVAIGVVIGVINKRRGG